MTTTNNNGLRDEVMFILSVAFIALLLVLFSGCKTIKTERTDLSSIDKRDSVRTEIKHVTDTVYKTVYVTQKDSTANEKESSTEIVFCNGGGTWNAQTGEATNVQSVKTSETERNLRLQLSTLESVLSNVRKELSEKADSISALKQQNNVSEKHEEKPRTNWYWWFVIGLSIGIALVIVLKKLPVTSVFMKWL